MHAQTTLTATENRSVVARGGRQWWGVSSMGDGGQQVKKKKTVSIQTHEKRTTRGVATDIRSLCRSVRKYTNIRSGTRHESPCHPQSEYKRDKTYKGMFNLRRDDIKNWK